jgi:predicted metal-dependent phosphoesterase TrpH
MIKCELHCHAKEDLADRFSTNYSYKELLKRYSLQGYNFVSLTFHNKVFFNSDVKYFAKKYGLIMCPATEITLKGKHVLVYDLTDEERKKIKEFDDLNDYFCIAPHPFYPMKECLNSFLLENKKKFSAIEISSICAPMFNRFNNRAIEFAKKNKIPLVATGDVHALWQTNINYTLIDSSSKNYRDVLEAIRKKKSTPVYTKGSLINLSRFVLRDIKGTLKEKISGLFN